MPRHPVAPLLSDGLVTRRLRVDAKSVVFIKGVVEAHEGLAVVFAEHGGELTIAAPEASARDLDQLLEDLREETGALIESG